MKIDEGNIESLFMNMMLRKIKLYIYIYIYIQKITPLYFGMG